MYTGVNTTMGEHEWSEYSNMRCAGIGFAICMMASYVAFYYNTIMAWSLYYIFATIANLVENWEGPDATHPPWATCGHSWNTEHCAQFQQRANSVRAGRSVNASAQVQVPLALGVAQVPSSQE